MTEKQWKKNDETEILIEDMGKDGEGIGHADGYTLFVKGALPGERVRVRLMKVKKRMGFARLMEVITEIYGCSITLVASNRPPSPVSCTTYSIFALSKM